MTTPAETYITPREAAQIFGIHRQTIYFWIKTKRIDSIVIDGTRLVRIPVREIERLKAERHIVGA